MIVCSSYPKHPDRSVRKSLQVQSYCNQTLSTGSVWKMCRIKIFLISSYKRNRRDSGPDEKVVSVVWQRAKNLEREIWPEITFHTVKNGSKAFGTFFEDGPPPSQWKMINNRFLPKSKKKKKHNVPKGVPKRHHWATKFNFKNSYCKTKDFIIRL